MKKKPTRKVDWQLLSDTAHDQELFAKMPDGWFCYVWWDKVIGGYYWGYRRTRQSALVVSSKHQAKTAKLACEDFCLWYNTNSGAGRDRVLEGMTRLEVKRVTPQINTTTHKRGKRRRGEIRRKPKSR